MPDTLLNRLKNAWNIFRYGSNIFSSKDLGSSSSGRPDIIMFGLGNEKSLVSSIYTRIGIDVSSVPIKHVRLDENGNFSDIIQSGINNCLSIEANIDQSGRAFIQDAAMSLCDEGVIAIVPVDTTIDPLVSGSYDILSMRIGSIRQWYPEHVRVNVYNDRTGMKQDLILSKSIVAIVENPLYLIMNEPNSTLQRLITKLNLLDVIDQQSGSGKLDLIVQLPYVIKTQSRKEQAERRRTDIEEQLKDSKYGIAYIDGTEKVTQLNRPAENNLMKQIEYLTSMLHGQLGITTGVFDGTADEQAMLNYYNRTIEPFLSAITDGMKRTFLTKTARSQGQSIVFIRDPFRLVPVNNIAEIADKFTRNEILTSNEFRSIIGFKPSDDPKADELRNKNLSPSAEVSEQSKAPVLDEVEKVEISNQNGRNK